MIHSCRVRRGLVPVAAMSLVVGALAATVASGQGTPGHAGSRRPNRGERKPFGDDVRVPRDAAPMTVMAEALVVGDPRADALLSGYKWSLSAVTYSFYEDTVFGGRYYGSETGVREVSDGVKQNVRRIMAWYTSLLNVPFTEVTETSTTVGHVRIMLSDVGGYAYAYYPSSSAMFHVGGDVHLNPAYDRLGDTNGFQQPPGEHGYSALIHEIGHAIGLKNTEDCSPMLPPNQDNHTNTVMSYRFYGESPGTPMAFDVLALQYLYGARPSNTGNDTYRFTRNEVDQYSLNSQLFLAPSYATKQTIWDAAGYNALDLSGLAGSTSGYRIDTNPMGWITTGAYYRTDYYVAGTSLGPGVRIHKVIGSPSSDTIYANADANTFAGYAPGRQAGHDIIVGANASDVVDLSTFASTQVTQTTSGNDLVLGLGGSGTITLRNYYAGNRPEIRLGSSAPTLAIGDVRVQEGDSGSVLAVFAVTLSAPSTTSVSVTYTTSNGTAVAGSDYQAASGTLTLPAGTTQRTITVAIVGDTVVEPDETFSVLLSAPTSGVTIADNRGDATIVNDDAAANRPPVAMATATPTSGTVPLAVAFSSAGSSDADGSIASYTWTFGNGATSTAANPTYTYTTAGTFTATLTVRDNQGATASRSVTVTVSSAPAASTTLFVRDLYGYMLYTYPPLRAMVRVWVLDGNNAPVAGATVTGVWSGVVPSTSVSAVTNSQGFAYLASPDTYASGWFVFTVSTIAKPGMAYDPARNYETSVAVRTY